MVTKLKHFLSIADFTSPELLDIFTVALKMKEEFIKTGTNKPLLDKKTLVMIFEKPSLRTRLSFETAMIQLGGHAINLSQNEIGMGCRESITDVAGVVSGMGDLLMARTNKHSTLEKLAEYSTVSVINGLSDLEHPCQAMADFFTIWQEKKSFSGLTMAFLGDGENNITHSLVLGAAMLGVNFRCTAPKGYFIRPEIMEKAQLLAKNSKAEIIQTEEPGEAVRNADIVYTDTWISMGDEKEKEVRLKVFKPYQVTKKLMLKAKYNAVFMHDMPAKRGQEVTEEVIDGPQSVVFNQAHNRLHVQKALLIKLLEEK